MNNTKNALKIGALYYLTENKEITKKHLIESEFDNAIRSLFLKTNKSQDDLNAENKETEKEKDNAS